MARPPRWLVVTSVLGALALGAAGAWFYLAQRQHLRQTASASLLTIAQAKLDQIVAWRAGHQPDAAADIVARLQSSKNHYWYDDVRLVNRAGRVLLAASGRRGDLRAEEAAALRAAFRDRRPTTCDVHVSGDDSFSRQPSAVSRQPSGGAGLRLSVAEIRPQHSAGVNTVLRNIAIR